MSIHAYSEAKSRSNTNLEPTTSQLSNTTTTQPTRQPRLFTQSPNIPDVWFSTSTPPGPGCPPGLQPLAQVDSLKLWFGPELNNPALLLSIGGNYMPRFSIRNGSNNQVMFVGGKDIFTVSTQRSSFFFDSRKNNAMNFIPNQRYTSLPCDACCWFSCCDCCSNQLTVEAPVGHSIGYIKQGIGCCSHHYHIFDEDDTKLFKFKKWNFCSMFCSRCSLTIKDADDSSNQVGIIKNCRLMSAEIEMDPELTPKQKALLLGALFVIHAYFYSGRHIGGGRKNAKFDNSYTYNVYRQNQAFNPNENEVTEVERM